MEQSINSSTVISLNTHIQSMLTTPILQMHGQKVPPSKKGIIHYEKSLSHLAIVFLYDVFVVCFLYGQKPRVGTQPSFTVKSNCLTLSNMDNRKLFQRRMLFLTRDFRNARGQHLNCILENITARGGKGMFPLNVGF
jgi:hypothetical protein